MSEPDYVVRRTIGKQVDWLKDWDGGYGIPVFGSFDEARRFDLYAARVTCLALEREVGLYDWEFYDVKDVSGSEPAVVEG